MTEDEIRQIVRDEIQRFGAEVFAAHEKPKPPDWLTTEGAAAHTQLSRKTIYTAVRSGQLRAAVVGGRRELRFRQAWLDAWLEATA